MSSHPKNLLAEITADRAAALTLLVGALGYFVDVFDLLLFTIVRVQSLKDMGIAGDGLLGTGILLLNAQMAGLLLGGIVWGIAGDKFGRRSVLFGSILLYSLANIANAAAANVPVYAVLRFVTGLGLAGELGVGVTLASELLPKRVRGLGTTFISAIGVMGAAAASLLASVADWRTAYVVGGLMGLALLVLRLGVKESELYREAARDAAVSRGNLRLLLCRWDALKRYLAVIAIGAPIWGVIGLFIMFTPEFAADFGLAIKPTPGSAVLFCYIGAALGCFFIGVLSQKLQSRRKSIAVSLGLLIAALLLFVTFRAATLDTYYALCGLLGFGSGYWAMFVQVGAEQFGTNIRSTAATTVPNVVRGLAIPITAAFSLLKPGLGVTDAGLAVMAALFALAFLGLAAMRETFHADLDFIEG
jgi:MFS family permease